MSSIGDKKVALNLSDGTSVNLNKPTVLDSTVTSFLGLKNGEYCGVCKYSTPEYNSDIFRSSIATFPFPIFRKGTEATGTYNSNYYYAECPTDVNFYLKVMDFVGDDNRNTQLYALQLRGANEDPVAGEYADFPPYNWDNGLYIGRSYYNEPHVSSLLDDTSNESTAEQPTDNNAIAWELMPSRSVIETMLPDIQNDTYRLDNNGVSRSDKKSVASAQVADYLADGINPRELSNGADLNKCLKVGKYGMDGITVTNGPVAVTIDGTVHYMDAANVGTNTPTTPTMNNAIMTVEMTGYVPMVDNTTKLIQTIVSDDFTVRRVISGLKGTSTLDVINTAASATTFGPWVSLVENNLTSTSTTAALSAKQGKVLNDEKAASKVLAIDADLNTVVTPGIYSCGEGNSIKNKPSEIDAIGLIVVHNGNGPYYTQILTTSTNRNTYRRYCKDGTWDSWTVDRHTDTDSWRGIQNNLTSNSTTESLSAAQGKVLNDTKQNKPTISTTDLTAGTSSLTTGEFYFVYD